MTSPDAPRPLTVREALEKYGEHQHEWVPYPTQRFENGAWRNATEPEEGWDRWGVRRICPDDMTGECWCGLDAARSASPDPDLAAALREALDEGEWPTPPTGTGRPYRDPEAAREAHVRDLAAALRSLPAVSTEPSDPPTEPDLDVQRLAEAMVAVMTNLDRPLNDGFEWYGAANDLARDVAAEYAPLRSEEPA